MQRYRLGAIVAVILASGCGPKESTSWSNADLVKYEGVSIELDESKEPSKQIKDIAFAINNNQVVSFDQVTNMLVDVHVAEYNKLENASTTTQDVLKQIQDLVDISKDKNMSDAKQSYEQKIEDSVKTSIKYNKSKVSLVHPLKEARLQCYSGSMLNMVINRKSYRGIEYRAQNYVMIYTDGHILPGKMEKAGSEESVAQQRNNWKLTGIETTAAKAGTVTPIGSTLIPNDVLIYDAELVALVEILKPYLTAESKNNLACSLRKLTADKYGIKIPSCEEASQIAKAKLEGTSRIKANEAGLNTSPLGIGVVDVPEGDIERLESEGTGSSDFVVIGRNRINSDDYGVSFADDESPIGGNGPVFRDSEKEFDSLNNLSPLFQQFAVGKCRSDNSLVEIDMRWNKYREYSSISLNACVKDSQRIDADSKCYQLEFDQQIAGVSPHSKDPVNSQGKLQYFIAMLEDENGNHLTLSIDLNLDRKKIKEEVGTLTGFFINNDEKQKMLMYECPINSGKMANSKILSI